MTNKLKIVELFSGIGSQTQALKNLGIAHTSICCEWKNSIHKIYESIHGPTQNLGDITKVSELPDCDLVTYSFPCQDISSNGNQKGFSKDSGTRSGLLWEFERLLRQKLINGNKLPTTLLLENVKQLINVKNIENFNIWLNFLESIGYKNSWKVLNAVDYGIPQHRERIFVVSSLNEKFIFPAHKTTLKPLSDFMFSDNEVKEEFGDIHFFSNPKMQINILNTINNTQTLNSTNRIYSPNGIVHTLTTYGHVGTHGAVLYSSKLNSSYRLREKIKGLTINEITSLNLGFDINSLRLATPQNAFLLMGFDKKSYLKAKEYMIQNKISLNNFYHVSGNSIVVPVLESIFSGIYG